MFEEAVVDIDGPLLKLLSGRIINSHTSLFVIATPITMPTSISAIGTGTEGNEF